MRRRVAHPREWLLNLARFELDEIDHEKMIGMIIPCDAARLCSVLKHDWLEHQVIRPLRSERDMWLTLDGDSPLPSMVSNFHEWVSETKRFSEAALEGFSPKQLVNQSPLSQLSEDLRELISDRVHQAYLDSGVVQPLVKELDEAIELANEASKLLGQAWGSRDPEERLRAIDGFDVAVTRMRDTLRKFPRGVVL